MISTAEALLGVSRHLAQYTLGPDRAALGTLELAGHMLEMAVRLRGSGVSSGRRVTAIALNAGITRRSLALEILPTLESLNWVEAVWDEGTLVQLSEQVPPLVEIVGRADDLLKMLRPEPVELAVLDVLDATTRMPLTVGNAVQRATSIAPEEDVRSAISYLQALNLALVSESGDGARVIYNPNIWGVDVDFSEAALKAEDDTVHRNLSGLIEELAPNPGLPEKSVTSTSKDWIDYAVAQGLVQRSIIATSDGRKRAFLFVPHMGRNAFSAASGVDPSGHVRQLIGSMIFAKNFAAYRLMWPGVFLRRLLEDGEAGDASSIGSDYPMLETAGIVRVEPADRFYKLVLLQPDVAERALTFLDAPSPVDASSAFGLRDQRTYVHPEGERAKLGKVAATRPEETRRLLAAIRQEARGRGFGH